MEIRQLKTFQMVATTLSFSRTATTLNYAQSTVTAQIQSLEEELGVPLFNRLGRRVTLTEAGKRLMNYAQRLMDIEEEARLQVTMRDNPMGTICIGAPETVLTYHLPRVMRAYQDLYPMVQLILKPYVYQDLYRAAHDGLLDIVFLIQETVHSSIMHIEQLVKENLLVVTAADYPLTQCENVTPLDLEEHPLLVTEPGCFYRHAFEHMLSTAGVNAGPTMSFYSVEAIKQCVIAGLGVAMLPQTAIQRELDAGELIALPWQVPNQPEFYTQMLWHKDRWESPAIAAFLELVREMIPQKADQSIIPA